MLYRTTCAQTTSSRQGASPSTPSYNHSLWMGMRLFERRTGDEEVKMRKRLRLRHQRQRDSKCHRTHPRCNQRTYPLPFPTYGLITVPATPFANQKTKTRPFRYSTKEGLAVVCACLEPPRPGTPGISSPSATAIHMGGEREAGGGNTKPRPLPSAFHAVVSVHTIRGSLIFNPHTPVISLSPRDTQTQTRG